MEKILISIKKLTLLMYYSVIMNLNKYFIFLNMYKYHNNTSNIAYNGK